MNLKCICKDVEFVAHMKNDINGLNKEWKSFCQEAELVSTLSVLSYSMNFNFNKL